MNTNIDRAAAIAELENKTAESAAAWRKLGDENQGLYCLLDLVAGRIAFRLMSEQIGMAQLNPFTGGPMILAGSKFESDFDGAVLWLEEDRQAMPWYYSSLDCINFRNYCYEQAEASEQSLKELLAIVKERGSDVE